MLNSFVTALRTLTIIPIPGKDSEKLASALPWFPVVGMTLGLMLYGTVMLWNFYTDRTWPEGAAALLVIMSVILTRGLHLDGLSDCADAFWGGHDKESVLRIMKDSSVGVFGCVTLICTILAKWICFEKLILLNKSTWIITAYIISRTVQVILAATSSYARSQGGTAESFVKDASKRHLVITLILSCALLAIINRTDFMWLIALACSWLLARLITIRCHARIGGITGDILGAGNEITEVFILAFGVATILFA